MKLNQMIIQDSLDKYYSSRDNSLFEGAVTGQATVQDNDPI